MTTAAGYTPSALREFLDSGQEADLHVPLGGDKPVYGAEFMLRNIDSILKPAKAPEPEPRKPPTAIELQAQAEAIRQLHSKLGRYINHGRTEAAPTFKVLTPGEADPKIGPHAIPDGKSCVINGLRTAPSANRTSGFEQFAASEQIRTMVLLHEDSHCRVHPFLNNLDSQGQKLGGPATGARSEQEQALAKKYSRLVGENVADAHAILGVAERDGVESARAMLRTVKAMRSAERGTTHDTLATLDTLGHILDKDPSRYMNADAAFSSALRVGHEGAARTFPTMIKPEEAAMLKGKFFKDNAEQVAQGLGRALHTYRNGPKPYMPEKIETTDFAVAGSATEFKPLPWDATRTRGAYAEEEIVAGARQQHRTLFQQIDAAAAQAPQRKAADPRALADRFIDLLSPGKTRVSAPAPTPWDPPAPSR